MNRHWRNAFWAMLWAILFAVMGMPQWVPIVGAVAATLMAFVGEFVDNKQDPR